MDGQENLERTWKVREKSGNLKINGKAGIEKFIYSVQEGKGLHSHEIVSARLPLHWGLLLKKRICSLGKQILSFKNNTQI